MAIFSAAAQVELKVNGVSLGKKPVAQGGVVHYDRTIAGGPILFKPGKLEVPLATGAVTHGLPPRHIIPSAAYAEVPLGSP